MTRLTPKAFLTKNIKGGRKRIWTELNKSGYFNPEDAVLRCESLKDQTISQLAHAEGKEPDDVD